MVYGEAIGHMTHGTMDPDRPPIPPREAELQIEELGVAELNRRARGILEQGVGLVWVKAEVGGVSRPKSGHLYFTLKDESGDAAIDAVLWRGPAMRYGPLVEEGRRIRCLGRVTVYEARGKYQLIVERVEQAGLGDLHQAFERLKAKLAAEGLFDPARKRPLPPFPATVGVVTSRSGAAFHDICRILHRRFPVRVLLAPASVQGDGAAAEIAKALQQLAGTGLPDVIISGRGGGSLEDLWAFNEEIVARAIAACPIPVVSAVGHETDVTIADFAADVRAATPSEAAELVAPDIEEVRRLVWEQGRRIGRAFEDQVVRWRLALSDIGSRLGDPRRRVAEAWIDIDELTTRLERVATGRPRAARERLHRAVERLSRAHPETRLVGGKARHRDLVGRLSHGIRTRLDRCRNRFELQVSGLEARSPLAVLGRGYAIARRTPDRAVVRSTEDAPPGTRIDVVLGRGELRAVVETIVSTTPLKPRPD